jgi:thiol-disulfide isomerase/thioredoxin
MKNTFRRHLNAVVFTLAACALTAASSSRADDVQLKLLSKGALEKLGGYIPQKLELSETKPDGIKKVPADLAEPLYGELKLGAAESPTTFFVILDEPEGKPARLFVDANANGDLTDDPAPDWHSRTNKTQNGKESVMYDGGATIHPAYGAEKLDLHIAMYRFDKHDPQRSTLAKTLMYYGDYARTGEVKIGDKTYAAILTDPFTTGDFRGSKDDTLAQPTTTMAKKPQPTLLLDLNNDGKFDRRHESFPVLKPFNIGGITYEISGMTASGASFALVKSTETVEETKPMASLAAGQMAIPFKATTTDSNEVNFPVTYKGKVVMLDFWATWCGPCVAELPNITAAYEKYHPQGLEILGVSLDNAKAEAKLAAFTKQKNMTWPQIYDGKYWSAEVAQKYYIESIPHAFLVDGDTGLIIAEGDSIRGENLAPAIEKALAKKKAM